MPLPLHCFSLQEKSVTLSQSTRTFSTLFLYLTILHCCAQVSPSNLHRFVKENFEVKDVTMRMLIEESLPAS